MAAEIQPVIADPGRPSGRAAQCAVLALVALPLLWLWPCVFGDRWFVPYDVNQFAPASITASDAELADARAGANFDVTEVPVWFLPEMELARDELRAGRWPTWNPHARGGAPLHAHGLIGLCYPPNWLALFADEPVHRLGPVAWCNLALAGLLAFGLLRQLGYGVFAASLGAALFELSGATAANSFFWMRLASFVWLPGVLWPMVRVAQFTARAPGSGPRIPIGSVVCLGIAFAMTWLGGFPPFAATTTCFAGLLYAWLIGQRLLTHGRLHALRLAAMLTAGLGLGALWAMPQVLPSLAFFPDSARPPVPLWRDISGQAFEPYGLLCYLMPSAFGDPSLLGQLPYGSGPMQLLLNTRVIGVGAGAGNPALPNYNFTEYSVFVSSFGAVLAALGALLARGRHVWFARTALLLAIGLGMFWPGLQLLFHLPVVQNVWPMRWPAAATLFVAWLAAAGCERLLACPPRLRARPPLIAGGLALMVAAAMWLASSVPLRRYAEDQDWAVEALIEHYDSDRNGVLLHVQGSANPAVDRFELGFAQFEACGQAGAAWLAAVGGMLLAFGLVRSQRMRHVLLGALAATSVAQLGQHGASITRGAANPLSKDSAVHAFLRQQAEASQASGGFAMVRTASAPGLPSQLPPGQLLQRGVRDLNFYSHADARTLQPLARMLRRFGPEFGLPPDSDAVITGKGFLTRSLPAWLLQHPWFDLMCVRFALTTEPGLESMLGAKARTVGPTVRGRGQFFVHERTGAMPRAYVVPRLEALVDDEAVIAAVTSRSLQPGKQVYANLGDLPDGLTSTPAPATDETRTVRFAHEDPSHIELEVAAGSPRFLVLADTHLPGWHATVDGVATEVLRGNHSQRFVVLPETACRVVFAYEAPGLLAGLLLFGFATVSAFATWLLLRRRRAARAAAA